jgi:hypothetical protein
MQNGYINPTLILLSSEALLHLSGYMNSKTNGCWSAKNSMSIYEVPLYDAKVRVSCVMNSTRIIGPIFL